MKVESIPYALAKSFIERWHYSGSCPKGKNIFFGCFDDNDNLYAVSDYGNGVNPYQAGFLSRESGLEVTNDNLVELKRLCRIEPNNPEIPLTKFLSVCHKQLKADGIKFIVSFSDPEHGHTGGIYKASNFFHFGTTQEEMHVIDANGVQRHRRYAYRYSKRNNISIEEARTLLGLVPKKTLAKDRWFLPLLPKDRHIVQKGRAAGLAPVCKTVR